MATNTGNSNQGENRAESQTRIDGEHDRRYDNNGQGTVKDPEHDGRLKENREAGISMQDADDNSNQTDNRQRQAASSSKRSDTRADRSDMKK